MASLKTLFKDTAVYGLSSIIGRFLNYLLVPLYTAKIAASSGGYGVITEIYSYVALLLVLLTFGMETTFFRFANKPEEDARRVYSSALLAVGSVGMAFLILVFLFLSPLSAALGYGAHPEYLGMMAAVVALDAFSSLPFAFIRYRKRAIRFASLKLLLIGLNIGVNLLYFFVLRRAEDNDVAAVFAINLLCSALTLLLLLPELREARFVCDKPLLQRMLRYAWPILVLGMAGILNQTADKLLFPRLIPGEEGHIQLGIYGASAKIAMIMAMITQAFRYAYEPFVFGGAASKEVDAKATQARATKLFLAFTLLAFLCVMGWMDVLQHLIGADYREGLRVVPIVMAAEILMGLYFNLSFWYKLTDRTTWGAWFSLAGCAVLVGVNILFVPSFGYMACAWAGVAGYGVAMLLSFFVGLRYYPIRYPLGAMSVYIAIAALFFVLMQSLPKGWPIAARLGVNTLLILAFAGHIFYHAIRRAP